MAVQVVIRHGGNSSLAGTVAKFGEGVVTIGRRADNVIAYNPERDTVVSGHHAELRIGPTAVTLHDLRSANGTFIGGEPVTLEGRAITTTTIVVFGRGGPTLAIEVSGLRAARTPPASAVATAVVADAAPGRPVGFDLPARDASARSTPVTPPPIPVYVDSEPYAARPAVLDGGGIARPEQAPPVRPLQATPKKWTSPASLILQRTGGKQSIGVHTLMGVMNDLSARDGKRLRRLAVVAGALVACLAITLLIYVRSRPAPQMTWEKVLDVPSRSIYVVCKMENGDTIGSPEGTAWSVRPGALATNSHVAALLVEHPQDHYIARSNCPNGEAPVDLHLVSGEMHPGFTAFARLTSRYSIYNPSTGRTLDPVPQCDVGLLKVADNDVPKQATPLTLATETTLNALRGGNDVAFIGFPMEQFGQGGLNASRPVAQLFTGGVTRVTDPFLSPDASPINRILISYQLIASGGASGSPVFDRSGLVIGFISAGNVTGMNDKGRLDKSGTAYGPRVDLLRELLDNRADKLQPARTAEWDTQLRERFKASQSARVEWAKRLAFDMFNSLRQSDTDGKIPSIDVEHIAPVSQQSVAPPAAVSFQATADAVFIATAIADTPDLKPSLRFARGNDALNYREADKYFTASLPIVGRNNLVRAEVLSTGQPGSVHLIIWRFPFVAGKHMRE